MARIQTARDEALPARPEIPGIAAACQNREVRFRSKNHWLTKFPAFASARRCGCARK